MNTIILEKFNFFESAEIEVFNGVDFNHYVFKYQLIESRSFDIINNFLST